MKSISAYHGIVIAQGFRDQSFPESFPIFAKRVSKSDGWIIYGVEVKPIDLDNAIAHIQDQLVADEPWDEIIAYGKTLSIPAEQLDFWPNRFQDESHYFAPEDFRKQLV